MMHAPKWILEALTNRMDHLLTEFQKKPDISPYNEKSSQLLKELGGKLESETQTSFLEWEDHQNMLNAMKSQWLYLKGVQDGLELMLLQSTLKDNE